MVVGTSKKGRKEEERCGRSINKDKVFRMWVFRLGFFHSISFLSAPRGSRLRERL